MPKRIGADSDPGNYEASAPADSLSDQLFAVQARLRVWHAAPAWSSPSDEDGNALHEPPLDANVYRDPNPDAHSAINNTPCRKLSAGQREALYRDRKAVAHVAAQCTCERGWSDAAASGDLDAFIRETQERETRATRAGAAATACSIPDPLVTANVDRHTRYETRWESVLDRRRTEDAAACVVARLDHARWPSSVKLERPISTELSASLILQLAPALAVMSPEGAKAIRRIALQIAREAHIGEHLPPDTCEENTARMRKEHARALDGLIYVSDQAAERTALAISLVRQAAEFLLPSKRLVPKGPTEDDGWFPVDVPPEDVDATERRAIAHFRESFPSVTADQMSDDKVIELLREMSRPEAPNKNTERGKAELARIREENDHRRAAKLPPLRPISLEEQARVCLQLLRLAKLAPPFSEDPITAVREALDNGWKPREEHWEIAIRDRQSAAQPSIKRQVGTTETRSADNRGAGRHLTGRDAKSNAQGPRQKAKRAS